MFPNQQENARKWLLGHQPDQIGKTLGKKAVVNTDIFLQNSQHHLHYAVLKQHLIQMYKHILF